VRETRIRATFDSFVVDPNVPKEALRPIVDYFVSEILTTWEAEYARSDVLAEPVDAAEAR
jgi:hypothetical protein